MLREQQPQINLKTTRHVQRTVQYGKFYLRDSDILVCFHPSAYLKHENAAPQICNGCLPLARQQRMKMPG